MKIIDAHAHVVQCIAGFTSRGELRSAGGGRARYADGSEFQMIPKQFGESFTADDLVSVMDENGVEKAVLLQGQFFGFQNEYTAQVCGGGVVRPVLRKGGGGKAPPFQRAGLQGGKV